MVSQIRALIQLKNNSCDFALLSLPMYCSFVETMLLLVHFSQRLASQSIYKLLTYVVHSINRLFLAESVMTSIGQSSFCSIY